MSFFDRFKRKDDLADESDYEKYERKHEALRNKIEYNKLKGELRERKREAHPYRESAYKTVTSGAGRSAMFAGFLVGRGTTAANMGGKKIAAQHRIRTAKMKMHSGGSQRSFVRPDGGDISLSQSIARADWSGERNVMNTEFFGQREQRDLLGNQRDKQFNMDIFGTKTTEQNLMGNNVNLRQNKKYY